MDNKITETNQAGKVLNESETRLQSVSEIMAEGVAGTFADITGHKQAEEMIVELALRNQTLLQTASDGIHVLDEAGFVVEANQAFCKLLGYTREELLQLNVADWDLQWSGEELLIKIKELIKQPAVFETRHRCKDGSFRVVEINGIGVNLQGSNYLYASVRDITERKQAEQLSKQTRQNYENFFYTIDDFLFVLDLQGNIIHTNNRVIDRLGYSMDELAGKSILMLHPPDRHNEANRIIGDMLNGIADFCPVPLMTKSGIQIPVETRTSYGNWDGRPVIFGVTKDISKIKLSEEKFSKLFHLNPSACGLSDLTNHKYIEVNEAFYNLFGFEKSEVIGATATELGIITRESINTILSKSDTNGNVTNEKTELKAKNGEIKHILLSSENIYVQDKKYRFAVCHDITDITIAEAKLQEKEERFRLLFEKSGEGILLTGPDGKIISANPEACKIFGRSEVEICLAGRDGLINTDGSRLLMETEDQNKSGTVKGEASGIRKDGTVFPCEITSTSFLDSSGQKRISAIIRDISLRKRSEEEIKLKSEELLKSNAEKDKFFSIIAHDLRSPFNLFFGYTQILIEELPKLTLEELQKIAVNLNKSALNLFRLLENLLEWSRIQRGLITFNPTAIQLIPRLEECLKTVHDTCKKKEIEIIYNVPENLVVIADNNILQTVIRNLVSNAVKFTPKGGKISLSAIQKSDKSVEVSISDSGIGMSHSMVENLFRLDVQTNRKGTDGEPSTGLGLIICKDLVEKHGGKLSVASEQGIGSTFRFTIPEMAVTEDTDGKSDIVPVKGRCRNNKNLTILIAEDQETSDVFLTKILEKFNHKVLHAKNGIEAIEVCRNNRDIDLVLMDIMMPDIDGYEATRQIRQFNKEVVIIAQTALAPAVAYEEAIRSGCNDYISKPIDNEFLMALIEKYFKNRKIN